MIVQCGQCSTKFRVNDASVGPRGAKVRCSRCQNVFVVMPEGKAPVDEESAFGGDNRTHAFDTSQFMRAAAAPKAAPKAPPKLPTAKSAAPKPAVATQADDDDGNSTRMVDMSQLLGASKGTPAPAENDENSTRMVDARQFIEASKGAPAQAEDDENSTRMVDARQFIEASKQPGAPAAGGFDEPGGNSTRMMNVADITKLADSGAARRSPVPSPEHDDETRIGPPPSSQAGEGRPLMQYDDAHDQPTAVSAIFSDSAKSGDPRGQSQGQGHGIGGQAPPTSMRLAEDPGAIQEIAVETMSVPPPTALSWVITALSTLILIAGLLVCFSAEQVLAMVSIKTGSASDVTVDPALVDGVKLGTVRSQVYPLTDSQWAWIVTGSVVNTTQAPVRNVDAVAELHDRMGRLVGTATGPVGLELDPSEIPGDNDELQALLEKFLRQAPPPGVDANGQASFVAVLLDPSLPMHGQQQLVHLAERPPLPPAPVEPAPAPAPVVVAPPPAPEPPVVAPVGKGGKLKGLKLKGKKKKAIAPPAVIPGTMP